MLTAFSDDGYQEQARGLGVSGYIVKPITSDVLVPMLIDALQSFRPRRFLRPGRTRSPPGRKNEQSNRACFGQN